MIKTMATTVVILALGLVLTFYKFNLFSSNLETLRVEGDEQEFSSEFNASSECKGLQMVSEDDADSHTYIVLYLSDGIQPNSRYYGSVIHETSQPARVQIISAHSPHDFVSQSCRAIHGM